MWEGKGRESGGGSGGDSHAATRPEVKGADGSAGM